MRNLIALLIVTLSATLTYAAVNPTVSLSADKTLVVNLNDWTNTDVEITIEDLAGELLHFDKFRSGTTEGRKYNLKNLPTGFYSVIIESDIKKAIHALEVKNNVVIMKEASNTLICKPYVLIENDNIDINHLALGKKIAVSIIGQGRVIFSKNYENLTTLNKRFDIKSLPNGDYSFIIEGGNQYNSYPFVK